MGGDERHSALSCYSDIDLAPSVIIYGTQGMYMGHFPGTSHRRRAFAQFLYAEEPNPTEPRFIVSFTDKLTRAHHFLNDIEDSLITPEGPEHS